MKDNQALAGVRVLDLSGTIASSVAGMLLGDYGAEVVHLKPAKWREAGELPGLAVWHRNKICSELDWASDASLGIVRELLRGADICITSDAFTATELGMNGEEPGRLIHLRMPPCVPLESGGLDVDNLLAAISGVALRQSSFGGGAIDLVTPYVSYEQGLWAATATVAALVEREKSGFGQQVTVDGLHGSIVANIATLVMDPAAPPIDTTVGPGGAMPTYSSYRCADDKWVFIGAPTPKFQQASLEVLGIPQVWIDPRIGGTFTNLHSPENRSWVRAMIADAFATQPSDYWLKRLEAADVPVGLVGETRDWLSDPQIQAIGQRRIVTDPCHGETVMGGLLVELFGSPAEGPSPRRFVPFEELPVWPGQKQPSGRKPRPTNRGPLDGIRVLNLGAMLAGPYGGMLMAELGADVVKVEPRGGDVFRTVGAHYNRGMRSLEVDLRNPMGHAAFLQLVGVSDVVMDNYRLGVLDRLAIDYESLTAVKPDVITVSVTGFGEIGPLARRPAFDPMMGAISGMQKSQGGDSDPVFIGVAVNDVSSGCAAAFAACLALFHRARAGEGQRTGTSLAAASVFMQSGELIQYPDCPPPRVGGRDFAGPSVLDRFYPSTDGYVRVLANSIDQFVDAGILESAHVDDDVAADQIAGALRLLSREEAVALLEANGIFSVPARNICELPDDPSIRTDYLAIVRGDTGGDFFVPNRLARFSRTERPDTLQTPGAGEHTRDLLETAGVPMSEIEDAIASGAVHQGKPLKGIGGVSYR
ncbi:CaiB/BaiF CoA-transferase family protein [Novosphingobium sp.]|uniref:CaiB/BaiF CoA-transferase family protein n=1 Tax=Novosphingobium sp. TaxID=1874826 RepID=UPI002B4A9097|nr:CoA transferase [Novosphingobium sp.]HKR91535.1 CoA transferase [Novosphingobium sp.]